MINQDWLCEKLTHLKIEEDRLATLNEIKVHLDACESLEAVVANKLLNSPEIFHCMDASSTSEQYNCAIEILTICMSVISLNSTNTIQVLEKSLNHEKPKTRALALNAILKELLQHPNQKSSLTDNIISLVVKCLEEPESSVGVPAIHILSITLIDNQEYHAVLEKLLIQIQHGGIVKCRVYEVAVNVAKNSPENLKKVEQILDDAISQLNNNDILFVVNVLEILCSLAQQNHGMIFLEQKGVFCNLCKRVEMMKDNPLDSLLIPGIMRFFGKISYLQPQKIITKYPVMIECLFETLKSGDPSILPTSFDTFANLASSQQGKLLLEANYSGNLKEVFENYLSCLKNLSSDLKNRAFNSLEIIFSTEGEASADINKILEKWFLLLSGRSNISYLLDFCRNPFPDIKVSCLKFIRVLCAYTWGIRALKNTAGFVEYLLDRRIEFDADAKLAKYEVIALLAECSVFDIQTQMQLRTYVNEGPYYVQRIVEVAIEGE